MVTTKMHSLLVLLFAISVVARDCIKKNQCACTFDDDGTIVDITSLGNADDTPKFKDVLAPGEGNYYSYNPCYPFNEGQCQSAASCVSNAVGTEQIQIGDAVKAGFKYDTDQGQVVVSYTTGTVGDKKSTNVILVCDPNACTPNFTAQGQQSGGEFQVTLTSACACPGGCSASGFAKYCGAGGGPGGTSVGLSGGSLILIGFFSLVCVYLVAGTVFMKVRKQARGTDVIPNKGLWVTVPGLIKDGVLFTFGKCRRNGSYQSI